jgi:hypothetical protein
MKLLCLVRSITFNFSSLECMLRLYITLVRTKLGYASVVWTSITSTDANKLECIQQRFAALCFNPFSPQVHYCYSLALEELKLHNLRMRKHRLDTLFLIQSPLVLNSVLLFWKLMVFEFLLGISETLLCSCLRLMYKLSDR